MQLQLNNEVYLKFKEYCDFQPDEMIAVEFLRQYYFVPKNETREKDGETYYVVSFDHILKCLPSVADLKNPNDVYRLLDKLREKNILKYFYDQYYKKSYYTPGEVWLNIFSNHK